MVKRYAVAALMAGTIFATTFAAAIAASPPNMLVIGTDLGRIGSLDPASNNNRSTSEVISNLYDTLVQTNQGKLTTVHPLLAREWSISADHKTITFTLRDDATFSSGNPVTAEDAAWSLQRIIRLGQVGSADLAQTGLTAGNVDEMVRATDRHTLTITLPTEINPQLVLQILASAPLGIVDRKTVLSHEKDNDMGKAWLTGNSAGSGPFTLAEWRPNDLAMFNARRDYWNGAPAMARVAVRHIPESGNLRLQMESGDVDVGQYLNAGDLQALETSDSVTIQNVPGFGFYFIALNMLDPDLRKPLVREAFQHVFDWQAVSGNLMRYNGYPWQSVIPKGMAGAPDEAEATGRYPYDPARAKALLAEAGYPDGIRKKLYPVGADLAQSVALQSSARAAGIDLEVIPGSWTPAFRTRDFEVVLGNSGAKVADPFAVATLMAYNPDNRDEARLTSNNMWRTAQIDEELNTIIEEAGKETDLARREELFRKIDQHYASMKPSQIIFFQRTDPYVVRSNVQGYHGQSTWSTRWNEVTKK